MTAFDQAFQARRRDGHNGLRGGGRQRLRRRRRRRRRCTSTSRRRARLPGLRRHQAAGLRHLDHAREGVERGARQRRDRRWRQRLLRVAAVSGGTAGQEALRVRRRRSRCAACPMSAGDADPATGYDVRVDGQNTVIGGTSAVAPLWAGLIALHQRGKGSPRRVHQPASLRKHRAGLARHNARE